MYEGFLVQSNVSFDLSVPTNAIEGALCVLNVIVTLIIAFANRNKFLKAMQARLVGIEASVRSLQARTGGPGGGLLEAALPALQMLVTILVDYKAFVQYITQKPTGFFDRAVSFFRAKSDLENLAGFDESFTRALADLNVPLQADQLAQMEAQRTQLSALNDGVERIMATLDAARVLAISKRVLTDEEALTFWMDCLPDKFQVPITDFVAVMFMWLRETKGMAVTRKGVMELAKAMDTPEEGEDDEGDDNPADGHIDARETNTLFQALPMGYTSMTLDELTAFAREAMLKRRATDKAEVVSARQTMQRRLAKSVAAEGHSAGAALKNPSGKQQKVIASEIEQRFQADLSQKKTFHGRFCCDATVLGPRGAERRPDVQTMYITGTGQIAVFGRDPTTYAEIAWPGRLNAGDLTMSLHMTNATNPSLPSSPVGGAKFGGAVAEVGGFSASVRKEGSLPSVGRLKHTPDIGRGEAADGSGVATGEFRGNMFTVHRVAKSGLSATFFLLSAMSRWDGYWLQDGQQGDMFFFMEEGARSGEGEGEGGAVWPVSCISDDAVGVAVWSGAFLRGGSVFECSKRYLGRHYVHYRGDVVVGRDGLRSISGSWELPQEGRRTLYGTFAIFEMMPTTSE